MVHSLAVVGYLCKYLFWGQRAQEVKTPGTWEELGKALGHLRRINTCNVGLHSREIHYLKDGFRGRPEKSHIDFFMILTFGSSLLTQMSQVEWHNYNGVKVFRSTCEVNGCIHLSRLKWGGREFRLSWRSWVLEPIQQYFQVPLGEILNWWR